MIFNSSTIGLAVGAFNRSSPFVAGVRLKDAGRTCRQEIFGRDRVSPDKSLEAPAMP